MSKSRQLIEHTPMKTSTENAPCYIENDFHNKWAERLATPIVWMQQDVMGDANAMRHIYAEVDRLKYKKPLTHVKRFKSGSESLEVTLFDVKAELKIITSEVSMHIDSILREKLFKQIDRIHDPDEWEDNDLPMNPTSYRNFITGLVKISPKRGPGLGVSVAGNVVAAWMDGESRLILEFAKDSVIWVVSRRINGEEEFVSGKTNLKRLYANLKPNVANDHFFD